VDDLNEYTRQYLVPSGFCVYFCFICYIIFKSHSLGLLLFGNSAVKPFRTTAIFGAFRAEVAMGGNVPNPACGCDLFGLLTVWPTEN